MEISGVSGARFALLDIAGRQDEPVGGAAGRVVARPAFDIAPTPKQIELPVATTAIANLDGRLLGARAAYAPATAIADIEPVDPPSGRSSERLFYVCGILTSPQRQLAELRALATHYGTSAIGVHHASRGATEDIRRFVAAFRGEGVDQLASVPTVLRLVEDALATGEPLMLVGHSQGALVIARALRIAEGRSSLPAAELEARLARIHVVTFAAAQDEFVDGPRYEHVVNRRDTVPYLFGPALTGLPGRGATVRYLEFDVADEEGVPDSAPAFYHAFNITTHGLKGHLDALEGKSKPPRQDMGG